MSDIRTWLSSSKSKGMSLGLERVSKALEKLGRPDKSMRCIHVAGSNGKGSVCAHLSSGLHRAGFKVGFFSSPHLAKIEERVRINGKPVDSEKFDEALVKVKSLDIDLTFFEITYLVSLIICSEENVRYMILETGLGGRLDATRSAEVIGCLVTSVSLEHSDILGDTLELVAKEKAAIWRSGVPMLIRDPEIPTVRNAMREEAVSAQFFLPDSHDFMEEAGDLAEEFCKMLDIPFVRRKITWPARMQIIEMEPKLMLEAAHNPSGMARAIPEIIRRLPLSWSLLFGTSPQQDMDAFLQPLYSLILAKPPLEIITTEPQNGRYPGVKSPLPHVDHIPDPAKAYDEISKDCEMILVIGSLYLCGNIMEHLNISADIN